ncbi:hypothetical protein, partial [Klebsiella pneumoniae]
DNQLCMLLTLARLLRGVQMIRQWERSQ